MDVALAIGDLFDWGSNKAREGAGKLRDGFHQLSGAEAVKLITELRADQEQLNLAFAARLKNLQNSTVLARAEAAEAVKTARHWSALAEAALAELKRRHEELDGQAHRLLALEQERHAAYAHREASAAVPPQRLQRGESWLAVIGVVLLVLIAAVLWLLIRNLA